MKNNAMHKWLYIVFLLIILAGGAIYLKNLENQRYEQTEKLSLDGMFPVHSHKNFSQELLPVDEELLGFTVQFYTRNTSCSDVVRLQLRDEETGTILQRWERNAESFDSDIPEVFLLDRKLTAASGRKLCLEISIEEGLSQEHISICTSSNNQPGAEYFGTFTVDDKLEDEQVLKMTLCTPKYGSMQIVMVVLGILALSLSSLLMIQWKPERILLVVLLVLGIGYFLVIPMLQVPDESGHYFRSYEISQGNFVTPKSPLGDGLSILPLGLIPEDMVSLKSIDYQQILDNLEWEMAPRAKAQYSNPTQALYSPISYLPQAVGCLIARLFTRQSVIVFYTARLFNFLACSILCYFAVKWIPFGKRFLLLACSMPMYLQQMISLSSDAVINAAAFFLIALVLKILKSDEEVGTRERVLLGATCGLVALCKVVYLPLCFLVLFIPNQNLWSGKKAQWYKLGICVGSTALNLGWMLIALGYMIEFRPGVNSAVQLMHILKHPFAYLLVVARTCGDKIIDWLGTMVGAKMCVLNVYTSLLFVTLYLICLGTEMILLDAEEENCLSLREKSWSVILFALLFGITLTTLYIQWTAVGSPIIEGFQGRYFIPILPLLAMALKGIRVPVKGATLLKFQLIIVIATNLCALFSIYTYY